MSNEIGCVADNHTQICDEFMTVSWGWIVILHGYIIYMGDFIKKLDNTFKYPPHPIPKPIHDNKY